MYLRKYNISKAAFLENTSQQLPPNIIHSEFHPIENTMLSQRQI